MPTKVERILNSKFESGVLDLNDREGIDQVIAENISEEGASFNELHRLQQLITPTENVDTRTDVLLSLRTEYDSAAAGFNWGDSGGQLYGLMSRFVHSGSGNLNYGTNLDLFCEINGEGSVNWIAGINNGTVLRTNTTAEIFKGIATSLEIENGASVDFGVIAEYNGLFRTGSEFNNYNGIRSFATVEAGAALTGGTDLMQLSLSGDGTVENLQCINLYPNLTTVVPNFTGINLGTGFQSKFTNFNGYNLNLGFESELDNANLINLNCGNDGTFTNYLNGVNLYLGEGGTFGNVNGISIGVGNNNTFTNATGVNVNMGNYDTTLERRVGLSVQNGAISQNHVISTLSNIFFDQANILNTVFVVQDGSPIEGTEMIINNMASGFIFQDDYEVGPLGLGCVGLGMVGFFGVAENKSVESISCAVAGMSLDDTSHIDGIVEEFNCFQAAGIINTGGPGQITANKVRSFFMKDWSLSGFGTDRWGFCIQDPEVHNYLASSLVIGGSTEQTTNDDIGLEVASKKALKLTGMTETERDALAPVLGMLVCIDDGATQEIQFYNGTAWVSL